LIDSHLAESLAETFLTEKGGRKMGHQVLKGPALIEE
jgi:hypothetical protein